jgi:hypothetical protein
LAAYLPLGGAKNKLLGGFAALRALLLFKMLILAKARRGGQAQSLKPLAAYLPLGGAKNRLLGGLARNTPF